MMAASYAELMQIVGRVRARWQLLVALRAWSVATAAGALAIGLALVAQWLLTPQGPAFILLWAAAAAIVAACLAWVIVVGRRAPDKRQVARYIEECCPELDDAIATAVVEGESPQPGPLVGLVVGDAVRRARDLNLDRIVGRATLRRAAFVAAAATAALVVSASLAAVPSSRAARLLGVYLFPERLGLEVTPGDVRLRAGSPLRILARIPAALDGIAPVLRLERGDERREVAMQPADGGFAAVFDHVEEPFRYSVSAASTESPAYDVAVVHLPHVERIDVRYEYPAAFRMQPRVEEDGGDIYGPSGTRVRVWVHTDKPVVTASLAMTRGRPVSLSQRGDVLEGEMTIGEDGSYRVALTDADGLNNPGDTEYFIRTLVDRPPDVQIVRPAADRDVTPLEEISIEARADDDFGIAAFDLVYSVGGAREKAVPFKRNGSGTAVDGQYTIFLEDLDVRPGDVISYYARVRDISRGKRSTEARSDIFFLEVKPFDAEFVASQSQSMSGGSGIDSSLQTLIEGQKDVITATWKLDRRARQSGSRSQDDIRTVARAQAELKSRAQATGTQVRRTDPTRGSMTRLPTAAAPDDPMSKAVESMGRAQQQLEALKTDGALPPEMAALNELMRAEAEVRRREVQRQQAGGGGRGQNRRQQDLSAMFDRELAQQQQTNYETPKRAETTEDTSREDDALGKIRELARRQEALNRQQRDLASKPGMPADEARRELERLTREQTELRRQAEELSRQMQGGAQGQQGQSSGQQSEQASRALREVSEAMRNAASELRRQDPARASSSGARAIERLQDAERRLQGAQPDDRRRALGELQLESQQLAEEQRRLANESRAASAGSSADAGRRRGAEQERLADRMQRLEQLVRELTGAGASGDQKERSALTEASREIERRRLSERMRSAARAERQPRATQSDASAQSDAAARSGAEGRGAPSGGAQGRQGLTREQEDIARGLDRLADRLGSATQQNDETRRLSDRLSAVRDLRNRLADVDRQLSDLSRQGSGGRAQTAGQRGEPSGSGRSGRAQGQRGEGQGGRSDGSSRAADGAGAGAGGSNGSSAWEETRALVQELQQREGMGLANPDLEGFRPGLSAPGTEGWKQDFAKWEELKKQVTAALERAETTTAARLRDQQSRDRLSAGATQAVPEQYRQMVDKYYRSLASSDKDPK